MYEEQEEGECEQFMNHLIVYARTEFCDFPVRASTDEMFARLGCVMYVMVKLGLITRVAITPYQPIFVRSMCRRDDFVTLLADRVEIREDNGLCYEIDGFAACASLDSDTRTMLVDDLDNLDGQCTEGLRVATFDALMASYIPEIGGASARAYIYEQTDLLVSRMLEGYASHVANRGAAEEA